MPKICMAQVNIHSHLLLNLNMCQQFDRARLSVTPSTAQLGHLPIGLGIV